ncbi:MAG TPA: FeoB small GTPase domain-containing protein, partial [Thermodesulfobacteriota bacterium]|nr:FeoB small GTPase domain-containing protein [Thermodesulfobacteriota bacterium]
MGLAANVSRRFESRGCHGPSESFQTGAGSRKIAILGSPNVGKSVLFQRLTGTYVTVSNYPGTTVEVFRGKGTIAGEEFEIIDTPGMYSFLPITEEERVARSILLKERPDVVLHVVDAKNLERMLPLTLQLLETGFSLILVLNIIDEAERLGMQFDLSHLEEKLKISIIATISTAGQGIDALKELISGHLKAASDHPFDYEEPTETFVKELRDIIQGDYPISKRSLATLLLQEDPEVEKLVQEKESDYE